MSEVGPDLPPGLAEAILSTGPGEADVDLVKAAFSWRTIDAELLGLSFDSANDPAGVRDPAAARSFEFTSGRNSVLVEVSSNAVIVGVVPAEEGRVVLQRIDGAAGQELRLSSMGRAEFSDVPPGTVRVRVNLEDGALVTPTFTVP